MEAVSRNISVPGGFVIFTRNHIHNQAYSGQGTYTSTHNRDELEPNHEPFRRNNSWFTGLDLIKLCFLYDEINTVLVLSQCARTSVRKFGLTYNRQSLDAVALFFFSSPFPLPFLFLSPARFPSYPYLTQLVLTS
jgi:hypothetical protein